MIESTEAYKTAITGSGRKILLQALIDIIDPDIVYGTAQSNGESEYSKSEQLHDKDFSTPAKYATLERNRWILDGTWGIYPDSPDTLSANVGFQGEVLSGDDGTFQTAQWVEMQFSNVSVLQACSVWFPDNDYDGIPVDFVVEVKQGGTSYFTKSFTGNARTSVSMDGFTVYNPDAIRVTVTKWSLPVRRMRCIEIVPGIYEQWGNDMIAELDIKHQGDFSCVSLPYGTCTLKMDNLDRRFEPRSKNGIFQSIEERQGIEVSIGVQLQDGTIEYKRAGIFYQSSGGWRIGDNGLSMQWVLVDIVGLLADREFLPPDTLPTTLSGWVSELVSQLGVNFEGHYVVDPSYENTAVSATNRSDVTGKKCGDVLRWACMASGVWPRADADNGYLAVEPLWNQGNKIDLDNISNYPAMKSNDDIAAIIFTLSDGNDTQYVVSGNSTASGNTVSVNNPFIHTESQALTAAKLILSCYGGNKLETSGRGDPSSEIGDVDTVWLNESSATTARRMMQTFGFSNGVLQNCQSTLLQADGSFLFAERAVITESGTWTAPAGVTTLRIIVGAAGQGGKKGATGNWDDWGADGDDGAGGRIWTGTININDGQAFTVSIGEGGLNGALGGDTMFGAYTSANGMYYENGYTDIANGDVFARTGVVIPTGSGDGGKGGAGGECGYRHRSEYVDSNGKTHKFWKIDAYPQEGQDGAQGGSGFVVVYWDKVSA